MYCSYLLWVSVSVQSLFFESMSIFHPVSFLYTRVDVSAVRATQPCIPQGSLNRIPASAEVKAGMSPLPGGR